MVNILTSSKIITKSSLFLEVFAYFSNIVASSSMLAVFHSLENVELDIISINMYDYVSRLWSLSNGCSATVSERIRALLFNPMFTLFKIYLYFLF